MFQMCYTLIIMRALGTINHYIMVVTADLLCRVPTFWKILKCSGNEKASWNVLESCKMSWKFLEINEFSGNLCLLKFGITVVPFL